MSENKNTFIILFAENLAFRWKFIISDPLMKKC